MTIASGTAVRCLCSVAGTIDHTIPGWDRHGLERLVRYCARPPINQERLGRLNADTLVYSLRRPTVDGRGELLLTPEELLDLLSQLVTPPRLHKHRFCGVLAPTAALREAVTSSAGPAGATLQLLEQARQAMGLAAETGEAEPKPDFRRKLARSWALLLARIYECLPLRCPNCGEPMRIIAFVLDAPTIERILAHIGEPTQPPAVLPARSPPQFAFGFDQTPATADWPEMDQTAGQGGGWE